VLPIIFLLVSFNNLKKDIKIKRLEVNAS